MGRLSSVDGSWSLARCGVGSVMSRRHKIPRTNRPRDRLQWRRRLFDRQAGRVPSVSWRGLNRMQLISSAR